MLIFLRIASFTLAAIAAAAPQSGDSVVVSLIEPIRKDLLLPALGAALITSRGIEMSGVTGVRKTGADVAATINDQWHLGSDTKAMTAVIIAAFVERGKLTWETTLGDAFKDLAATFPVDFRAITVTQLLSHHAGLIGNLESRSADEAVSELIKLHNKP